MTASRLRTLRQSRGYTRADLARAASLPTHQIVRFERRPDAWVPRAAARAIARALDIDEVDVNGDVPRSLAELRHYLGYSYEELCERTGWGKHRIRETHAGGIELSRAEVRVLSRIYRIRHDEVRALARSTSRRGCTTQSIDTREMDPRVLRSRVHLRDSRTYHDHPLSSRILLEQHLRRTVPALARLLSRADASEWLALPDDHRSAIVSALRRCGPLATAAAEYAMDARRPERAEVEA